MEEDKDYIPSELTIIEEVQSIAQEIYGNNLDEGTRKIPLDNPRIKELTREYQEHLKSIGKSETISPAKIADLNNKGKMPTMIKHCVVAIQPTLRGEGINNSFVGAHNICFWSFNKHKLTSKNYGVTGRGSIREKYHKTKADPDAGQKTKKYESLFNRIFRKK